MQNPHLPPLNALRAFEAAGRLGSFQAASGDLGVTQSAVAQQVRALEAHLGQALFTRARQGLDLTDAGRRYHATVARAFDMLRRATADLVPAPGRVTLSVTPTFASKWLLPRLPDFTRDLPDIDLAIVASGRISRFGAEGVDIAIRLGAPPFGASLEADLLFAQVIVPVAAPGLVPHGDLTGVNFLQDSHDLWPAYLDHALGPGHRVVPRGPRFSQTGLCLDAALAGQGVALAPLVFVARDLAAGRLVQPLGATLTGPLGFHLLLPRAHRPAAVARVRAWFVMQAALPPSA